jgi:hypothetical protein
VLLQVKIRQLEELLKRVDLRLHNHIISHEVQYLQFSFRGAGRLQQVPPVRVRRLSHPLEGGPGAEEGLSGSVPDPRVFWPPGSGSISQRYGSGSGSGSFYHQAKKK